MGSMSFDTSRNSSGQDFESRGPPVPKVLQALAAEAGVQFNGDNAWDINVRDPRLYKRILLEGSLGFGEAYVDGWWECEHLDELFHRLLSADADQRIDSWMTLRFLGQVMRHALFNLQSNRRAFLV